MMTESMRSVFDDTVSRMLADHITPARVLAAETAPLPADLWQLMDDSGIPLALVPEEAGGAGALWPDLCGVLIACGEHSLPLPLPETLLANWLLHEAGLALPGGPIAIAARHTLQREDAGSDARVSGTLNGVPWGRAVNHVLVVTGAPNAQVLLLAVADAQTLDTSSNTAAEPRDNLHFIDARPVARAALPAHLPDTVLWQVGALLRAAQTTGALQRVLALATDYANERVQFGKPIGRFQAIQHQLAQLAEQTSLSRSATETAFGLFGNTPAWTAIAAAKICSAEAASAGAAFSHSVHGAIGFTHEYPLHLATRRLWSWRGEYGSATDWSIALGQRVCRSGSEGLWPGVVTMSLPG
jgi:acyl-CoA dehydrogenase